MDESKAVEGYGGYQPRKLKTLWTQEAAQELQALWGTDLVSDIADQMRKEIDAEILHDITRTDRLVQGYLFAAE